MNLQESILCLLENVVHLSKVKVIEFMMITKLPINIIVITLLLYGAANCWAQSTRYVKPIATGNGSGSSWANASDDLQAMINASSSNDNIHVAEGTYKPIRRADDLNVITPNDRDNAFVLKGNIKIYGGYPPTGTGGRDVDAHPTILSGDIGVLNDSTDNCYHVVMRVFTPGNSKLDGFTIRDGNANEVTQITVDGEAVNRGKGGGIYNINRNFDANNNQDLDLVNCTFVNNAAIEGGAIYNGSFFRTYCYALDCTFLNNSAVYGGAVCSGGYALARFRADRCSFINNTATDNGGGLSNGDNNNLGFFTVSNSSFNDNIANNGGGIYNGASNASISLIRNCNFIGNTANEGSSVYTTNNVSPAELNILNSIIWDNNNTNGDLVNNGGSLTATYSFIEDGYTGTGNSTLNPLFVDPSNGDFSLQIASPAINAGTHITYGNGNLDLAGNNRIVGESIDVGAYESPYGEITPDSAGIVYVNINVIGGNRNGHNWLNAVPELADALVAAKTNTAISEIWVAQGTYKPRYSPEDAFFGYDLERDNAFLLVNNVKVYGGFQNANETNINQRDTINLNTILSAERSGSNCYHVVVSTGSVGDACINGFTIKDGYASGSISGSNTISVNGVSVSRSFGGGIFLRESNPSIKNCDIIDNYAGTGGGISIFQSHNFSIFNCRISNNSSSKGGGICNQLSTPVIENCIISNNSSFSGGEGGGIYTSSNLSTIPSIELKIKNSIITGNSAPTGAGIYLTDRMDVSLTNCTLADNDGNGAIYSENNSYCSVAFRNTILWDNNTGFEPGAGTNSYTSFNSLIQDKNDFPANGNLDGTNTANDPLFTDVQSEDFTLLPCSPAINAGSNSEYTLMGGDLNTDKDLSNNPREFDGIIDMGAYELQTLAVSQIVPTFSQISPICTGDSLSLPPLSDNGISGTWSPAPNNTQTTTYSFTPAPGSCTSSDTIYMTVTVNPLDHAGFEYVTSLVCVDNITVSPSNIVTPGGTFTSQPGLSIDGATGEIDIETSQIGTYTITYTTAHQCSNYSTEMFTINDLPDASFTYPNAYYCTSSANPFPTVAGSLGVFSAVPSGLSINSTTGEINLLASSEGVYEVTNLISSISNCPSVSETVTVSVEESPIATISLSEGVLIANEVNGATYQWINCSNQNLIPSETGTEFAPTDSGSYAVIITSGNCATTSECETVSLLALEDQSSEIVKIYPNPSSGFLYISSPTQVDVKIITMDGKVIQLLKNAEKIDLTNVANSIYLVRITDKDGVLLKMERIVVNK